MRLSKKDRELAEAADLRDFWLNNFLILISTALFVAPVIADFFHPFVFLGKPVFLFAFLAAPLAVAEGFKQKAVFTSFALITVSLAIWDELSPDIYARIAFMLTLFLFAVSLSSLVLSQVLREGTITTHRIKGAIAFYLLVGIIFQIAYVLIELLNPGSFKLAREWNGSIDELVSQLTHFSFVTLTTVGYGNIFPISKAAQTLSNFESLIGQLYPAILIARLVSLQGQKKP